MKYNFIWNSTNSQEQKEYIKNKILEWIKEDEKLSKNQSLTITLSITDPLDNILNGKVTDDKQNTIYEFQSNQFLDKMTIIDN